MNANCEICNAIRKLNLSDATHATFTCNHAQELNASRAHNVWRIYTEDINRDDVLRILDSHFPDGYTVIPAIGRWNGKSEPSLVIELVDADEIAVNYTANEILVWNKQEAVLVTHNDTEREVLTRHHHNLEATHN